MVTRITNPVKSRIGSNPGMANPTLFIETWTIFAVPLMGGLVGGERSGVNEIENVRKSSCHPKP